MPFVFKGSELVASEPLGADDLTRLVALAARRPVRINGVEFDARKLEDLAAEARRTNCQIRLGDSAQALCGDEAQTSPHHTGEGKFSGAYQARIAAHAARAFNLELHGNLAQTIRAFLKTEDRRLRFLAQLGAGGIELANLRAFAIDALIKHIFRLSALKPQSSHEESTLAIVALGGYGRGELAPFSDVDILFLHAGQPNRALSERIERILQLLWDARLDVGNFNYSVAECLSAARGDAHLQTALLSARFITGSNSLYEKLSAALQTQRRKIAASLLETLHQERRARYLKFSPTVALLEPNMKDGAGGLRDLHTALWASSVAWDAPSLKDLRRQNLISADDELRAARAYDFLWRARFNLHWMNGRKTDRLALDLQPALAQKLNYCPSPYLLASEQLMRDYYRRANEIYNFCEQITSRASEAIAPRAKSQRSTSQTAKARFARWMRKAKSDSNYFAAQEEERESFSIRQGQLQLDALPDDLARHPLLFFEAVRLAQTSFAPLSFDLRAAMRANLRAIDRAFRQSKEASEKFLKILRERGRVGFALRLMHETGLLSRYLPEFARVTFLIQHDFYHQYTIDEHTLRAVEAIDDLANGANVGIEAARGALMQKSLDETEDAALLYLAVLFHDLGKGRGRGHIARGATLAKTICARMQLDEMQTQKVVRLVSNHVLMAQVSQRRDLSEPRIVEDFAAQVGARDELNMLFLLTYADMRAVGAGVWNEWKGALLCELYTRARNLLCGKTQDHINGDSKARTLIEETARAFESLPHHKLESRAALAAEAAHHFALLPANYAPSTDALEVAIHLKLIRALNEQTNRESGRHLILHWHDQSSDEKLTGAPPMTTQLTIVARDRRGLFADLAGALAASGTEILSATLNTRRDGVAIDTFILREAASGGSVEHHRRPKIERMLEQAVNGEIDLAAAVERWRTRHAPRPRYTKNETWRKRLAPQINSSNDISATKTVVEVCAPDEHGLAYKIARTLTELNLDISRAKIATERSDALDVFYVTRASGEKLSETEIETLKQTLLERLND